MKTFVNFILISSTILLIGCALQAMFIAMITDDVYQFEQYNFTAWLFQILYWVVNISLGLYTALDECDK